MLAIKNEVLGWIPATPRPSDKIEQSEKEEQAAPSPQIVTIKGPFLRRLGRAVAPVLFVATWSFLILYPLAVLLISYFLGILS